MARPRTLAPPAGPALQYTRSAAVVADDHDVSGLRACCKELDPAGADLGRFMDAAVCGFGSDWDTREARFLRSDSGGRSWTRLTPPEELLGLASDPEDPRVSVALGEQRGWVSRDGGANWRPLPITGGVVTWTRELGLTAVDLGGAVRTASESTGDRERGRPADRRAPSGCRAREGNRVIGFETSVRMERPIEDVFAFVSDPLLFPRWNSAVQTVHGTSGQASVPGSRYSIQRELPSGRVENELEVLAREHPSEFGNPHDLRPDPVHLPLPVRLRRRRHGHPSASQG